jgi:DHA1 family bicyclomycin/chloramphenicol resistance-like MFS transporter
MTQTVDKAGEKPWAGPGMREFVALMAALMAGNALAVDAMLPALPQMSESLGLGHDNQRQLVITCYLIGFGAAQIVMGPLSDRFGRRPVLLISLVFYAGFTLLAGLAASFTLMLTARVLQGIAAAAARVLVISIVRDRYEGASMAKVMSFTTIVFMLVPVLAPAFGQAVLLVSGWRTIFFAIALYSVAVMIWAALRLPETLPSEYRRPLSLAKVSEAMAITLNNRLSIGNTLALTLLLGALFAFINSIQQIIFDVFDSPNLLAALFAMIGVTMAISSYVNSRIVEAFGPIRLMTVGLIAFVGIAAINLAISAFIGEYLIVFSVLLALCVATFGFVSANLGSIAMQPLGHVAGTASSVQGLITTLGGALIGLLIGQLFDGSTIPLLAGFLICGIGALIIAHWANKALSQGQAQPV